MDKINDNVSEEDDCRKKYIERGKQIWDMLKDPCFWRC